MPDTDAENYERLAAALRELGARLRVGGMTDAEARRLPVVIDARTLRSFGNSTWMTDAGPLDLLVELRGRDGGRHPFADLATRAVPHDVGGVVVRASRVTRGHRGIEGEGPGSTTRAARAGALFSGPA